MPTILVSPKNQVLLVCFLLFLLWGFFLANKIMKETKNSPEVFMYSGSQSIASTGNITPETEISGAPGKILGNPTNSWTQAPGDVNNLEPIIPKVLRPERVAYDFISDDSLTKFVSPNAAYLQPVYVPDNLVKITPSSTLSANTIELRKESLHALVAMSKDFQKKFGEKIIVVSGYRSYAYQQGIEKRALQCVKDGLCARAGYSEHQSGLAIDIFEATTQNVFLDNPRYREYFKWLNDYAHAYGFINTYKKWIKIDGYHEEPWHWRYVWKNFAIELHLKGMSFAEYMKTSQ